MGFRRFSHAVSAIVTAFKDERSRRGAASARRVARTRLVGAGVGRRRAARDRARTHRRLPAGLRGAVLVRRAARADRGDPLSPDRAARAGVGAAAAGRRPHADRTRARGVRRARRSRARVPRLGPVETDGRRVRGGRRFRGRDRELADAGGELGAGGGRPRDRHRARQRRGRAGRGARRSAAVLRGRAGVAARTRHRAIRSSPRCFRRRWAWSGAPWCCGSASSCS